MTLRGSSLRSLTASLARSQIQLILAEREAQERTKAQAGTEAFLAEALKDFEKFASLIDILPKDNQPIRFVPNRIQRRYLATRTVRDIILKARQQGITTVEQIRDLFYFLTVPGARVVVVCQSVTGDAPLKDLTRNFQVMLESLQRAGMKFEFTTEAVGHWVLKGHNSSLKVMVSGASEVSANKKGRAGTISRLHVTECAFFEYADATLNAMLECVPGSQFGSEIVIESTANGASGFFFRQCKAAKDNQGSFKFHFFPWYETDEYATPLEQGEVVAPVDDREKNLVAHGVTAAQLKWYRAKIADKGADRTAQEYPSDPETCFLVFDRGFFDPSATTRLLNAATEPVERRERERVWIWRKPLSGKRYLISVDTAEGGGGDPSGAIVRERESGEQVASVSGQYTPWELAECVNRLGIEYNKADVAVERNNHGHAVLQALEREHKYPKLYKHDDAKLGWPTNAVTRPTMLDALEDAHRKGLWTSPDRRVLEQFRTFIVNKSGKAEAARDAHDDLVMAEAIGWAVRSRRVATYAVV